MKHTLWILIAVLGLGFSSHAASPVYTSLFSSKAVGGYDAVSFFDGEPAKGNKKYSTEYMGATWLFASEENLRRFEKNPAQFAPQYGGYCAWAAAQDKLASGDPKYWKIVEGKLYLNYDADVQADWEKDIPGFIQKADQLWPALVK